MIGELYPQKVRGLVGGMTTFAAHTFVFIVVKTYPMLKKHLERHGTFILYGVISLLGKNSILFIQNHISNFVLFFFDRCAQVQFSITFTCLKQKERRYKKSKTISPAERQH